MNESSTVPLGNSMLSDNAHHSGALLSNDVAREGVHQLSPFPSNDSSLRPQSPVNPQSPLVNPQSHLVNPQSPLSPQMSPQPSLNPHVSPLVCPNCPPTSDNPQPSMSNALHQYSTPIDNGKMYYRSFDVMPDPAPQHQMSCDGDGSIQTSGLQGKEDYYLHVFPSLFPQKQVSSLLRLPLRES